MSASLGSESLMGRGCDLALRCPQGLAQSRAECLGEKAGKGGRAVLSLTTAVNETAEIRGMEDRKLLNDAS